MHRTIKRYPKLVNCPLIHSTNRPIVYGGKFVSNLSTLLLVVKITRSSSLAAEQPMLTKSLNRFIARRQICVSCRAGECLGLAWEYRLTLRLHILDVGTYLVQN